MKIEFTDYNNLVNYEFKNTYFDFYTYASIFFVTNALSQLWELNANYKRFPYQIRIKYVSSLYDRWYNTFRL